MQLKGIEAPGLPGFQFLHYEIMTSAGTGRFAGNVGGGYVTDDTKNLTWNLGARAQIDTSVTRAYSIQNLSIVHCLCRSALAMVSNGNSDRRSVSQHLLRCADPV